MNTLNISRLKFSGMAFFGYHLIIMSSFLFSQVVTSIPAFPTINDSVVVIFNAQEGSGNLAGYTGDLYTHTGVITDQGRIWLHVIGTWGNNTVQPILINLGQDLWKLNIGNIHQFYGIPQTEKILKLAFVFRSSNSQRQTENVFLSLFEPGLTVVVSEPEVNLQYGDPLRSPVFSELDDTLKIAISSAVIGTQISSLTLFVDNTPVAQTAEDTLRYDFIVSDYGQGIKNLTVVGIDTADVSDSTAFVVMVNPPVQSTTPPTEIIDGINIRNNSTVSLSLFAPFKKFVYVIGDFNDWKVDTAFYMNRYEFSEDSVRFWITIDGLDANIEYAFQYLVDGKIRIGDPYAEKILAPWNDKFINESTYPNLKAYPDGKTAELLTTFKINEEGYEWQISEFQRPALNDLVIYELLIRDFIAAHNYSTLIDTLNYLENLGINAIELMPVNEFDGNISWGYNPAFYFAPDKYYGTKNEIKEFIDECHKRGIAVLVDIVLNHTFGQSPFVRLYNEGGYSSPTPENPWLNVEAKHPFNVGYDFNHESPHTQALLDRVTQFWLTEYNLDGYRFDLSKGFTQKFTTSVSAWGNYDASRIAILKRMADKIWSIDPSAYVILEHFAANSEDKELADYGMMIWANMNTAYSQSAMGWLQDGARSSDLAWGYYKTRNLTKPNLLTYMESHDEPWLMYKNLQHGRSSGNYNIKDLDTALERIKLVAVFFFTIPGPKMIWQFGELGYDKFLPESGPDRTSPKPILWNYFMQENRNRLYRTYAALLKLRNENEVFRNPESGVLMRVGHGQYDRRLNVSHSSMKATIIGNFHVVPLEVNPNFQHSGTWYDYFSGDSIQVTNTIAKIPLKPGEFHIYTDKKLETPDLDLITGVDEGRQVIPLTFALHQNYPNPFNPMTTIKFEIPQTTQVFLEIYNLLGQKIRTLFDGVKPAGDYTIQWDGTDDIGIDTASGIYIMRMTAGSYVKSAKIIKIK